VHDVAGSPYYVAPEILRDFIKRSGKVWRASDMWSVGVIIYLLVCGYPPFNGDTQDKIFAQIKKCKFRFPPTNENPLSSSVKDLIGKLLIRDPLARLTAEQVLSHPWVTGETASDAPMSLNVIESIGAFRSQCRLKKAVAKVMSNRMIEKDKTELEAVFKKFDTNNDGHLSSDEISQMLIYMGRNPNDAKSWMEELDSNKDGTIDAEEFKLAYAAGKLGSSKTDVKATFDMFDADGDGFVTPKELEKFINFGGHELKAIVREVDQNADGKINFTEWLAAMQDIDKFVDKKPKEPIKSDEKKNTT